MPLPATPDRPDDVRPIALDTLSDVEQRLIKNTSMNQTLIEHITGEDITVRLIEQREDTALLNRHVHLLGRDSGTLYCEAWATVNLEGMNEAAIAGLRSGKDGLGHWLMRTNREMARKPLWWGLDGNNRPTRYYVISLDDAPIAHVEERFVRDAFKK